jgi:hypothetical protein
VSAQEILAAEKALGIELVDWQRSIVQRMLDAQAVVVWPKRAGKTAVVKVVRRIWGVRAGLVVVDEAADLP